MTAKPTNNKRAKAAIIPKDITFEVGFANLITEIGLLKSGEKYTVNPTDYNKIKYLVKENKIKVI